MGLGDQDAEADRRAAIVGGGQDAARVAETGQGGEGYTFYM